MEPPDVLMFIAVAVLVGLLAGFVGGLVRAIWTRRRKEKSES
jgi:hypothetical protein